MPASIPPVKQGDIIDLAITAQGRDGDGLGRLENFVIFVKGSKVGESLKVKITHVRPRYAVGEPQND